MNNETGQVENPAGGRRRAGRRVGVVAAGACATVAAGAACWLIFRSPPEPVFQGKTASYWIAHFSDQQSPERATPMAHLDLDADLVLSGRRTERQELPTEGQHWSQMEINPSVIAIRAMGPKAIPVLLETLGRTNLGIGRNAVELLDRLGPLEQNTITALVRRMLARESSGHQFYRAVWNAVPAGASRWLPKPSVPQPWARRYLDYWFRQAQLPYAVFLGKLESAQFRQTTHPEAIDPFRHQLPLLNAALHDPIDWVSEQAAVALRKMGLDARESIPQLIHELQNTKRVPEVRATVACALGRIGPGSPEAVMALVRATSSPDRTVQCGAIVGLGGGGGFDENETVATLRQLNYSAKQLVTNRLREIWKGNDALMAYLAYESLCNVDPDGVKGTTKPQPIASERNDGILAFNSPGSDYSLFIRFRRR